MKNNTEKPKLPWRKVWPIALMSCIIAVAFMNLGLSGCLRDGGRMVFMVIVIASILGAALMLWRMYSRLSATQTRLTAN